MLEPVALERDERTWAELLAGPARAPQVSEPLLADREDDCTGGHRTAEKLLPDLRSRPRPPPRCRRPRARRATSPVVARSESGVSSGEHRVHVSGDDDPRPSVPHVQTSSRPRRGDDGRKRRSDAARANRAARPPRTSAPGIGGELEESSISGSVDTPSSSTGIERRSVERPASPEA